MKPVVGSRTLLIAEVDGEPAGLVLGMPDLGARLARDARQAGADQAAAHDPRRAPAEPHRPARDRGAAAVSRAAHRRHACASPCTATSRQMGLRQSFYYPVNDSNVQSRGLAESLGGEGRILLPLLRQGAVEALAQLDAEQLFQPLERPVGAAVQHGGHADRLRALAVLDAGRRRTRTRAGSRPIRSAPSSKISGCGL